MQVCTWHRCGNLRWDHATIYQVMALIILWADIAITIWRAELRMSHRCKEQMKFYRTAPVRWIGKTGEGIVNH